MKKLGLILFAIIMTNTVFSQVETTEKKEVKVEREVKVTEENGVKKVEVTTIHADGSVEFETFTGIGAEKKLEELKKEEIKNGAQIKRIEERKTLEEKPAAPAPAKTVEQNKLD